MRFYWGYFLFSILYSIPRSQVLGPRSQVPGPSRLTITMMLPEGQQHHHGLGPPQSLARAQVIAVLGKGPGAVQVDNGDNVGVVGDGGIVRLKQGLGVILGTMESQL